MYETISERRNGDAVGARGWDENGTGLKGFSKSALQKRGVRFEGDMDEEEDDDESGEFESYCSGDDGKPRGSGARIRGEADELIDDLFERTLEEYGSDDMGDLADEVGNYSLDA